MLQLGWSSGALHECNHVEKNAAFRDTEDNNAQIHTAHRCTHVDNKDSVTVKDRKLPHLVEQDHPYEWSFLSPDLLSSFRLLFLDPWPCWKTQTHTEVQVRGGILNFS